MKDLPYFTLLNPRYISLQLKLLLLRFAIWRSAYWESFVAEYPWIHFLMKWEMCQLPLQMRKELGTSEADCNNTLHGAERAMMVDSPNIIQLNRGHRKMWPIALEEWWGLLANMLYGNGGLQNICYKRKRISSNQGEIKCVFFLGITIVNVSILYRLWLQWHREGSQPRNV